MKTGSKLILLAAVFAMITSLPATAAQYRWTGGFFTDPHNFQAGRNWNPWRTSPLTTDTLYFRNGARDSVVKVPTETVSYLRIDSLTQVVMSPDSSGDSLKISHVFLIDLNSSLTVTSAKDVMWLYMLTGSGAGINGTLTLHADSAATCHRFEAAGKNTIGFDFNGTFIQECNGSVFGSTGQDSIVFFNSHSVFINRKQGSPFGFAAGSNRSKVCWYPGSRYVHQCTSTPSLSGRRYADFECDPGVGASIGDTASGTAAFICDSLIITTGVLIDDHKYPVTVNGDLRVETGAQLDFEPTAPINWSFTGNGDQHVKGDGSIFTQPKTKLVVNKPSGGLYLMKNFVVADTAHLTKGLVYTTGTYYFYNSMSKPVIYYGDSSYIVGNYVLIVPLGTTYLVMPVGTANGVSPLLLWTNNVTTASKTMLVSAHQGVHPNAPWPGQTLQRYWHITSDLVPGVDFSNYEAVFYYRSVDFNTGFIEARDEATMVSANYTGGAWSFPAVSYRNISGPGGSIDIAGLTTFSDFTMAKGTASFDTTKPRITGTFPANNANSVPLHAELLFAFSEPIDTATFAAAITPPVAGLVQYWNGAADTLLIDPVGDGFKGSTTYTAKITAAQDIAGNPLATLPDSIVFTTVPNQGPEINMVQMPQDTYDSTAPFVIKAVITDLAKSVVSTELHFGSSYIPGTTAGADTFSFQVGDTYAPGTVIEYYLLAIDDQGDTTRSPAAPYCNYKRRILFPLAPTSLAVTTGANVDSLSWSAPTDSLNYAAASNGGIAVPLGSMVATRFTPLHDYYKIERAVSLWQVSGYDSVRVHVYADNYGLPDMASEWVTPFKIRVNDHPALTVVDLRQYNLCVSAGDFHIAYEFLAANQPFARMHYGSLNMSRCSWDSFGTVEPLPYQYALSQAAVVSYSSYGKKGAKEVGHYEVYRDAGSGYSWLANDYDLFYADNAVANGSTYGYQVRAIYPRNSLPDTFSAFTSPASVVTVVNGAPNAAANRCFLGAARPNPMKISATISFGLATPGKASIEIYNLMGQRVRTLADGALAAGQHSVNWNGRNDCGQRVAGGVYLCHMQADGFNATRKLLIVK